MFKQIKSLSTYKAKTKIHDTPKENENTILTDDREKCEAFASQFEKTHEITYHYPTKFDAQVNQTYTKYE